MNKITHKDYIQKCIHIHKNQYDYSKSLFSTMTNKIIIICKIHGEFEQLARSHVIGHGCEKCGLIRSNDEVNLSFQKFINDANIIYNYKYDYSKFNFITVKNKSIIICPTHGEFIMDFDHHIHSKRGCKKCQFSIGGLSIDEKIIIANDLHKNKYNYTLYVENRVNYKSIIICPIHGEFNQSMVRHITRKYGCPKCAKTYPLTQNIVINRFIERYNDLYCYDKFIFTTTVNKSIVICKIHGEFMINAANHMNGHGCPKCCCNISMKELLWLNYLNIPNDLEHRHVRIYLPNKKRPLVVDGYQPDTNTIYEFYGDYYHGNLKIYNENDINMLCNKTFKEINNLTINRANLLKEHGFNIIEMWEYDWDIMNGVKRKIKKASKWKL